MLMYKSFFFCAINVDSLLDFFSFSLKNHTKTVVALLPNGDITHKEVASSSQLQTLS